MCFLYVSHRNIPTHTHTHTHNIAQLVERSPRLQAECRRFESHLQGRSFFPWEKSCPGRVVELFVVAFPFYLVPRSFHIHVHLYMTPIMLYISKACDNFCTLPFYLQFVDGMHGSQLFLPVGISQTCEEVYPSLSTAGVMPPP